jgi:3D (Asp-Asp-Asp) domain-containing protein
VKGIYMKFLRTCFLLAALVAPSLSHAQESQQDAIRSFHIPPMKTEGLRELQLWGTNFHVYKASDEQAGIPLLDMQGKELGPKLSPYDWCMGGIEGTIKVGDVTYNFDGTKPPQQVDCANEPKVNVSVAPIRYRRAIGPFGDGVPGYKLVPWRTVAVNPKTLAYGTLLFIPEAVGQKLPDGTIHDGYFFVADTGSPKKIYGNHIDFFTGFSDSPDFSLLSSKKHPRTFNAFIVKDPALVKAFTDAHR